MSKYSQFFSIINKSGLVKEEVVLWFTDNRTDSLTSLSEREYQQLLAKLQQYNGVPPGDSTRKKMIGIARSMNWGITSKQVVARLDEWLVKQKYKKKLMALNIAELNAMCTIFETKVYADYLSALNK